MDFTYNGMKYSVGADRLTDIDTGMYDDSGDGIGVLARLKDGVLTLTDGGDTGGTLSVTGRNDSVIIPKAVSMFGINETYDGGEIVSRTPVSDGKSVVRAIDRMAVLLSACYRMKA